MDSAMKRMSGGIKSAADNLKNRAGQSPGLGVLEDIEMDLEYALKAVKELIKQELDWRNEMYDLGENEVMLDMESIVKRIAELEAEDPNASPARRDLMRRAAMIKGHLPTEFLLAHGRDYAVGPDSYKLPRGEVHGCYMNAAHLAIENPEMTYVEGKMACHGVALDHAWCVDADGLVVDPTIREGHDGHISDYFGVPFETAYLRKALVWNRYYGLLDYFVARETAPKLYELGLEAGQRWVLDNPKPKKPRKKKAAR